ncbi:S8 family peptidase [Bacillus sp. FJAT-44742]|uniref:S8 family peptidase n=1 Tax=Bacillus sp. FJAT-44742 TaxID=2014005 RepID=UPI000C24E8A7|nr:S8 family peptidase [Bacillus sp. FJAT-44742]
MGEIVIKKEVRLIPYRVEKVMEKADEKIPKGIEMIQAPKLWEKGYKGKGCVIAVLDTGCQPDHPDLKGRIVGGKNFTEDYGGSTDNFSDNQAHGTHVAGTIAASLDNQGVVGAAPEVSLLILKVLSGEGYGSYQSIIDAIHYAIDWRGENGERVRVISMSLGGPDDIPSMHEAIKRAIEHNILVVSAAGNEGDTNEETTEIAYPGYYKEVVQVGAVDSKGNLAPFTNFNDEIDLVAPGVDVLSTYPGSSYARLSGTSMATPHVSGAAALLISQCEDAFRRELTEAEIFAQLIKRTVSLGNSPVMEGNGLLILDKDERFFTT